jgi:hypothetical protein
LQQIFLFDHLVGEREQRRRQVEAERLGRPQIEGLTSIAPISETGESARVDV